GAVEHVDGVRYYERSNCLELDAVSVRNLELVEPLFSGESAQTTLFYTLDACCTPMGKRLLRATLLRPANGLAEIEARLGGGGGGGGFQGGGVEGSGGNPCLRGGAGPCPRVGTWGSRFRRWVRCDGGPACTG